MIPRQPMETAPRDGTRILLEYQPYITIPGTTIQEVYWLEHDLGNSPGWCAWCGPQGMQSTERFYHPIGWWPNPRSNSL